MPDISIIIPSYNQGGFIERTIRSIINQSFRSFEILVQDGASTDNTADVVARLADEDDRISFVSEPDEGFADAVNKALRRCTGSLVGIQSSDDVYNGPHVFDNVWRFWGETGYPTIVSGSGRMIDSEGRAFGPLQECKRSNRVNRITVLTTKSHFSQHSTFFSRERALAIGGLDPEVDIVADTDFWIRLLLQRPMADTTAYVSRELYGYVTVHPDQRSANLSRFYIGRLRMMVGYWERRCLEVPDKILRRAIAKMYCLAWAHTRSCGIDSRPLREIEAGCMEAGCALPSAKTVTINYLVRAIVRKNCRLNNLTDLLSNPRDKSVIWWS